MLVFFSGDLTHLRIRLSLVARYQGCGGNRGCHALHKCNAEFLPPPIGSPVKGSRQLAAEGLTAINYQLLALHCGQRSLVGNGLARSVRDDFARGY